MKTLSKLIKRDIKLFFKDKGMFFTSLITPLILLVLYATFLGNVYKDSFLSSLEAFGVTVDEKLINGCVGGQLISSLLAVCCVTVAFCSNLLMVQDKANGTRRDLTVSPVKAHLLSLAYYIASFVSTLIICLIATAAGFIYLANVGWYLSASDAAFIILDVVLLVLFGTALSSVINFFLSSQGQISAVGTIVSSCYGFICGAYMPISQFSEGLQRVISFLPGSYGTSLLRNHSLRGVFAEMESLNFPKEAVKALRDVVDCNLYFFDNKVGISAMYAVVAGSTAVLMIIYIALNCVKKVK